MPVIPAKNTATGLPNAVPGVADIAGLSGPFAVAGVLPQEIPLLKQAGKKALDGFFEQYPWVNNDLRQALTFAQQKYPRLFGHLTGIGSEPQHLGQFIPTEIQNFPEDWAGELANGKTINTAKTGILQINPRLEGSDAAATVGHELLHAADNVTIPNMYDRYVHSRSLPSPFDPYHASSYEIRANMAGDSFATKARTAALTGALSPK